VAIRDLLAALAGEVEHIALDLHAAQAALSLAFSGAAPTPDVTPKQAAPAAHVIRDLQHLDRSTQILDDIARGLQTAATEVPPDWSADLAPLLAVLQLAETRDLLAAFGPVSRTTPSDASNAPLNAGSLPGIGTASQTGATTSAATDAPAATMPARHRHAGEVDPSPSRAERRSSGDITWF
jgi:hypothetical protein